MFLYNLRLGLAFKANPLASSFNILKYAALPIIAALSVHNTGAGNKTSIPL